MCRPRNTAIAGLRLSADMVTALRRYRASVREWWKGKLVRMVLDHTSAHEKLGGKRPQGRGMYPIIFSRAR